MNSGVQVKKNSLFLQQKLQEFSEQFPSQKKKKTMKGTICNMRPFLFYFLSSPFVNSVWAFR